MNILNVAICDDIPIVSSMIENFLYQYSNCAFNCDCYNNPANLIDNLEEENYEIFILDIEMPVMNGLDIAIEIRKKNINAYIIFVTSYDNYMPDVFKVNTFDYLVKPLDKNKLYNTLDRLLYFIKNDCAKFCYVKRNNQYITSFQSILYFEKKGRYVLLYENERIDKFIMSTKELLSKLDNNFIQIHTSFIINVNYLERLLGNKVILKSESKVSLPISRKYKLSATEKISDYMEVKLGI